jgi:hypothetical protein
MSESIKFKSESGISIQLFPEHEDFNRGIIREDASNIIWKGAIKKINEDTKKWLFEKGETEELLKKKNTKKLEYKFGIIYKN